MIFNIGSSGNSDIRTVEGSGLCLEESKNGGLKINAINGKSVQDGTPTPDAPVEIKSVGDSGSLKIKIVGKNHLKNNIESKQITKNGVTMTINDNKSITLNGTCTAWGIQNLNLNDNGDELDGTYYISGASKNAYLQAVLNETGAVVDSGYGAKVTFDKSLGANKNWIRLIVNEGVVYNNETIYPLLRKCDDNGNPIGDDTYEPYQSNSVTIPLSEPLRQYDKIVKQDGVWGVERCPEENTLDENMNWYASSVLTGRYTVTLTNVKSILLCDQAIVELDGTEAINQCFLNSSGSFCINTGFSTLDEWKAHLAEKPLKVVCILATPTFEPFDTEVQITLNSLKSYGGVTYVSTDSEVDPVFILKYGVTESGAYSLEALGNSEVCKIKLDEINKALPYAINIDDNAKTIDFTDR